MQNSKTKERKERKEPLQTKEEFVSYDAPPLNFANCNIKTLNDIKHVMPRQGKRKPITQYEQEDQKDEKKKEVDEQGNQQNANQNQIQVQGSQEDIQQDDKKDEEEREKEKRERERIKEQRETPVINRTIQPTNISYTMTQSMPQQQKGHTKIMDDGKKGESQNSFKVKLVQCSLILSYNKIRSLMNFSNIMDSVMYNAKQLRWIDLSHNYLETLDYNFVDYPNLKSLYLHGNYLKDLAELEQLSVLKELKIFTIHGNPIDTIDNFRLYVIGMLPNLKKLDSVVISKKEFDNMLVWKFNFGNTKPPAPKIITRPDKSQGGE